MPSQISVAQEQKLAYLSQYTSLENPYVNSEFHPLRGKIAQEPDFWSVPLHGKLSCWYCGHEIMNVPYPCPTSYNPEKQMYQTNGVFCFFSCVMSYIIQEGGHAENSRREWLTVMARHVYGYKPFIRPIDKRLFVKYGGSLTHQLYLESACASFLTNQPLPLIRLRKEPPFIPTDMLIEYAMKKIDFLKLDPERLAPPSQIQQPFFPPKGKEGKEIHQPITKEAVSIPVYMMDEAIVASSVEISHKPLMDPLADVPMSDPKDITNPPAKSKHKATTKAKPTSMLGFLRRQISSITGDFTRPSEDKNISGPDVEPETQEENHFEVIHEPSVKKRRDKQRVNTNRREESGSRQEIHHRQERDSRHERESEQETGFMHPPTLNSNEDTQMPNTQNLLEHSESSTPRRTTRSNTPRK